MWVHFLEIYFLPLGPTVHGPLHFLNPDPSSHAATAAPHSSPPVSPFWGCPQPLSRLIQVWPSLAQPSLSPAGKLSHIGSPSSLEPSLLMQALTWPQWLCVIRASLHAGVESTNIWVGECIMFLLSSCLIISGRCSLTNKAWVSHGHLRILEDSQRMSVVSAGRELCSDVSLYLHPACA